MVNKMCKVREGLKKLELSRRSQKSFECSLKITFVFILKNEILSLFGCSDDLHFILTLKC